MRRSVRLVGLILLAAVTGCGDVESGKALLGSAPTGVSCEDASELWQRALDERRQIDGLSSDHARIVVGNRASYVAALAIVAALECQLADSVDEAEALLQTAFAAVRRAEDTTSAYEKAQRWSEADFTASQAARVLIQRLQPAK